MGVKPTEPAGTADAGARERVREGDALTLFSGRVGRDAMIYGATGVISIVFGLVSVAVLTRICPPAQYGHLAVYTMFMVILMVIYNLGSLQGTMSFIFGGGGDEDDDDGDDLFDPAQITTGDRRRALGTGLILTLLLGVIGTIPIWFLAPDLAPIISKGSHSAGTVRWAAIGGAVSALWRLAGNVTRIERRPYSYAWLHALHPLLTMSVSIPLLATGYGVEGAVAGVAIGNVASLITALWAIRQSVRPAFSPRDVVQIYRLGSNRVLSTLATWTIHNGDLFMASRYLAPAQVGIYRVGSRVGAVTAHWTSAFNMSYGPLRRDPLYLASTRESGTQTEATAGTYFVILTAMIILGMAVFARLLVHIAGPRYAAAAGLIPLAALSFGMHGVFVLTYRLCTFHTKRRWFLTLGVLALPVFIGAGIPLTESIGIYGPITAAAGAYMIAAVIMLVRDQFGEDPVPFEWWRMARALMCAGATYLAYYGAVQAAPGLRLMFAVGAMLLFPALLFVTLVVPVAALPRIMGVVRAVPQRWSRRVVAGKLAKLPAEDRELLQALARDRLPTSRIAEQQRVDEATIHRRLVVVLRRTSGIERTGAADARLGYYVVYQGAPANREVIAHELYVEGVEPGELHELDFAYKSFRTAPRRVWAAGATTTEKRAARAPVRVRARIARKTPAVDPQIDFVRLFLVDDGGECEYVGVVRRLNGDGPRNQKRALPRSVAQH